MKLEKSANRCEKSGMERQNTKIQDKWKYMSLLPKSTFFLIFLISFIFSIFFVPGNQQGNANTVSRMAAVFAILQDGSLKIDRFASLTTDKAMVDGHAYSDKAPGQILAALLPAGAALSVLRLADIPTAPLQGDQYTVAYMVALWVSICGTSALFTALAAACLAYLARLLGASSTAALFCALGYALCTPALGWASVMFSHGMAAGALCIAFVSLQASQLALFSATRLWWHGVTAGAAIGLAILTEFTVAIPALLISLLAMPRDRPWPVVIGMVVGGLPFAVALGAWNYIAFGSVTQIGYAAVVGFDGMRQGVFGISWPRPGVAWALIFSPYRGIIWFAPWLVFLPIAAYRAWRAWPRVAVVTCVVVLTSFLCLNAGYSYWDGGWSTGPRHLMASLPFACLLFAPLWDAASAPMRRLLVLTASLGAALAIACASVDMAAPSDYRMPLFEYILPRFLKGDVHNALTLLGGQGHLTLLALPVILLLPVAALWAAMGKAVRKA